MSTKNYNTACQSDSDCYQGGLNSGYKCNTAEGICEIQCANNQTYVNGYGCCPNNALWNGGCCAQNGIKISEVDGVKMCGGTTVYCPEGKIYDSKTKTCIACEDVTGVIQTSTIASCAMCPNLVRVSKYQCAPACTDPDTVRIGNDCKCPMDRPLFDVQYGSDNTPQCRSCDYNGQVSSDAPYGYFGDTNISGYYCNRRNGGGYSNYCAPGTVGVSVTQTIILSDGSSYKETSSSGKCKDCAEVDVSALKYQASCESCGGTWAGDSWDNGTCIP
jgi:hypothetical protein